MTTPQPHHLRSQGRKPKRAYDDKDAIKRKWEVAERKLLAERIAHAKLKKFVREEMSR
jgi:hypothetical protein